MGEEGLGTRLEIGLVNRNIDGLMPYHESIPLWDPIVWTMNSRATHCIGCMVKDSGYNNIINFCLTIATVKLPTRDQLSSPNLSSIW